MTSEEATPVVQILQEIRENIDREHAIADRMTRLEEKVLDLAERSSQMESHVHSCVDQERLDDYRREVKGDVKEAAKATDTAIERLALTLDERIAERTPDAAEIAAKSYLDEELPELVQKLFDECEERKAEADRQHKLRLAEELALKSGKIKNVGAIIAVATSAVLCLTALMAAYFAYQQGSNPNLEQTGAMNRSQQQVLDAF